MAQTLTTPTASSSAHPAEPSSMPIPVANFQPGKVLVFTFGHFTHDIFTSFLSPLLPLLIQKMGLSLTLAGTLAAFQQLPSLANPLFGILADKGKLCWLIILAPAISALCMSLIGLAPGFEIIALLLLFSGLTIAIWHTSTPAIAAKVSGRFVGRGMSIFMLGGSLAYTVGPLLAVAAVSWWGLEGIWRLFPLGICASALLYWQTRQLGGFESTAQKDGVAWSASWHVLKRIMLPMSGILITQGFMLAALTTYLPTYLTLQGASLWMAGGSLSILEGAATVGALATGTLSDRLGRRMVLFVAMLFGPLLMMGFLVAPGWLFAPALMAVGFFAESTSPVVMALVNDYSRDYPATANGLYFMINFITRSVIVILVGAACDHFGLQSTFWGCAFIGLLSIPFVWMLPGKDR